jgi:hypothetical protein
LKMRMQSPKYLLRVYIDLEINGSAGSDPEGV